ncbi:MAG: PfkB family carbohydrate kinase [Solirubrobacterales bacterium]
MSSATHGSTTREPTGGAIKKDAAAHPYTFDYVTVGHVTVDVLDADGARRPGGTAFYSALQAARLGLRTLILTRGVPAEIEELLGPYREELDVRVLPAERTTTLLTHGSGHARRQRLLAWAGPIQGSIEVDAAILHLAPVARETPGSFRGRAGFVGLTPQGLVREWNTKGEIALVPLPPQLLPERCEAIVLSTTERESCAELVSRARAGRAILAVTAGARPTAIQLPNGALLHVPPLPIEEPADDIGAGDVFAAAFFAALREGRPPAAAAAFANAAAAVRIAGTGPGAIGDRRAIEARLSAGV